MYQHSKDLNEYKLNKQHTKKKRINAVWLVRARCFVHTADEKTNLLICHRCTIEYKRAHQTELREVKKKWRNRHKRAFLKHTKKRTTNTNIFL